MARCPSCGNETDLDVYICDNCGYQMKVEKIESIPIFARPQERWFKPDPLFKRLAKTIIKPNYAFRDINKKKDSWGPRFIRFFNGLLTGLWGVAIFMHIKTSSEPLLNRVMMGSAFFIVLFIFGLIYWRLTFWLYSLFFELAANFSVQLDGIIAIRYNVKVKKGKFRDFISGRTRLTRQKKDELSPELLQKKYKYSSIRKTGKKKLMNYAYTPFVIANLLSFIVLLIGLPTIDVGSFSNVSTLTQTIQPLWDRNFVWSFLDILQIIAVLWSTVLMSLAFREIGNTNTTRLLVGNLIVAILIIYTTIFLRPTLGWNLDLIAKLGGGS
ncbi:zinc ribbon domain-containing protein [Candidatus Harpocratesius sp.]